MLGTGFLAKLTKVPYPIIGSVVIPVALVAAYLNTVMWQAIALAFAFCAIGLLMKRHQWPRPPLVLGFILGPIFEMNLRSAMGFAGGLYGVLMRPLTLTLLVFLVVFVIGLNLAATRTERDMAQLGQRQAARARTDNGSPITRRIMEFLGLKEIAWSWSAIWRSENILAVGAIAIGSSAVFFAMDFFNPKAAMVPIWLGIGFLSLVGFQLFRQLVTPGSRAEIMDLGMRSAGMAGSGRSGSIIFVLIVMFAFVSMTVGMKYAAVAYAVASSMTLLAGDSRNRVRMASLTGVIVAAFVFGLADRVMHVM